MIFRVSRHTRNDNEKLILMELFMKKLLMALLSGLMLAGLAGVASAADMSALAPCKNCHDLSPEKRKIVGPPLFGIYGSKPTIEGLPADYTVWDDARLDKWEEKPQAVKPRSKMNYRTPSPEKRAAIIAALKELK